MCVCVCVCVALVIQHARACALLYCYVWPVQHLKIFPHCAIDITIFVGDGGRVAVYKTRV